MEFPHLFERPLPPGWVYPCSLEDIRSVLCRLPGKDIRGLWSVGLWPSTRKGDDPYGKYLFGDEKPKIRVYSMRADLRIKQRAHDRIHDVERLFAVDRSYGMRVEQAGARVICAWEPEELRRFVLRHVLLHEVGHHVCHVQRHDTGLVDCPGRRVCEQFADHWALRKQWELWGYDADGSR